jgi:nucleoside 2-deoxyribosyltransferase
MAAILHGPSLDDGVCMEIGYAAASGIPVLLLTTDFPSGARTHATNTARRSGRVTADRRRRSAAVRARTR